jgi:hypothetical protein
MLQPWQTYYALTYESKWKADVDHRFKEFTAGWIKNNPGQPLNKMRFKFRNAFMREKYEAETTEMKGQVEKFRQASLVKSSDETLAGFQE